MCPVWRCADLVSSDILSVLQQSVVVVAWIWVWRSVAYSLGILCERMVPCRVDRWPLRRAHPERHTRPMLKHGTIVRPVLWLNINARTGS